VSKTKLPDLDKGHPFYSKEAIMEWKQSLVRLAKEEEEMVKENRRNYREQQRKRKKKKKGAPEDEEELDGD